MRNAFVKRKFLLLCSLFIFYIHSLIAQPVGNHQVYSGSIVSNTLKTDSSFHLLKKIVRRDSFFQGKNIKISSAVAIESRYSGLHYAESAIPTWVTTYKFNNRITLFGLPLQMDILTGNRMSMPGTGISRFQLSLDVNSLTRDLIQKAMEEEEKKMRGQMEADSDFIQYKQNAAKLQALKEQVNERQFNESLEKQEVLIKQYESVGDSALLKKPIYRNAKNQFEFYQKQKREVDSLKKIVDYADRINPGWKQLNDSLTPVYKKLNLPDSGSFNNPMNYTRYLPAYLRWMATIRSLQAGLVYPDYHPLIFKGAPLKGVLIGVQKKNIFMKGSFGKLYSPADLFRNYLVTYNIYAMTASAGYESKHLKICYTLLQTRRINLSDTFAFRYYFESPRQTLVHGVTMECFLPGTRVFLNGALSNAGMKQTVNNNETVRNNDINKFSPGTLYSPFLNTAFQLGITTGIKPLQTELTFQYNFQGTYYFSPMRIFSQPPGTQFEGMLKQYLFKRHVHIQLGGTLQQHRFNTGFYAYNDKLYSLNFRLTMQHKKWPVFSLLYQPLYRISVYRNEEVLLKSEQILTNLSYSYQMNHYFAGINACYNRNRVFNIYPGVYEQGTLCGTIKQLKSPLGYTLVMNYLKNHVKSIDSMATFDVKLAIEYQVSPTFSFHGGGGCALNNNHARYYPYFDVSWSQAYIGIVRLRADYTWLHDFGVYKQGMTLIGSITRKVF